MLSRAFFLEMPAILDMKKVVTSLIAAIAISHINRFRAILKDSNLIKLFTCNFQHVYSSFNPFTAEWQIIVKTDIITAIKFFVNTYTTFL